MKIFYKLMGVFLFVALMTASVAYIGMTTIDAISSAQVRLREETVPVLDSLQDLRLLSSKINVYTHEIIFSYSKDSAEAAGDLRASREEYNKTFKTYETLVNRYFPEESGTLDKLKRTGGKFDNLSAELIEMKRSGLRVENLSEKYDEFEEAEKEFLSAADDAIAYESGEIEERSKKIKSAIVWSKNAVFIACILTFILTILIGSAVSFSISNPLMKLKAAAEQIGRDKLDTKVDIRSNDETGALASAFSRMVHELSHEIKQHKLTVEELVRKNEFVKTVLESLSHPFYVIDANDYTILLANSAALTKDFKDGITCHALTHKNDKPCGTDGHRCPLDEVKRTKKPVVVEHLHYDKEGNVLNVEVHCYPIFDGNGNVVRAIEYSLDITERKRAEKALADSESRIRAILGAIPDMLFRLNREGIFLWFKPAREIEPLVPPAEFLGRSVHEVLPPRLAQEAMQYAENALMTGVSNAFSYELPEKGIMHYFEARMIPMGSEEVLIMVRDVTEYKKSEEMRRENERLVLANKSKSEFLAIMSHELRTPLNAIMGFSELLIRKDAGELNEKQRRYADNVYASGKNLLYIIDGILDLTRVESGKMDILIEKVSIPVIVSESVDIIKEKAAARNVVINGHTRPEVEFIETDGRKLRQVLNNLLGNAVKFSKPDGGTVTITVVKEGDMAKFSVSDTGIGIQEENMSRLFLNFEQLDAGITRKYGGTGLGLSVSKKLVELLGGSITVESRYGEGSTFTFYLPVEYKKQEEKL